MSESDPSTVVILQDLPRHIAIIMDGNGRWARRQGKPRVFGHRQGVKTLRRIVEACVSRRIANLTVYAFSSENWQRPAQEVNFLMDLFVSSLQQQIDDLHRNNIRVAFIGDHSAFPEKLNRLIDDASTLTAANDGLRVNVAANYGGRWDITHALRQLAVRVKTGELQADAISETMVAEHLCLAGLPEPDLFIRTGGEQRISNYLLWQLAYTELYFTDCLWPDFDEQQLQLAIEWYRGRERRFGKISEQINRADGT